MNNSNDNSLKHTPQGLDSRWYYDSKHFDKELNRIWQNNWLYCFHQSNLTEKRCYQRVRIAGQDIIVVRTNSDEIKAYYNSCRHRGSVLLPDLNGRLKSDVIVCPYHQWCYQSDTGKLLKTSSFRENDDFNKKDYGLLPVPIFVWCGLIFVNFSEKPSWRLADVFQYNNPLLAKYPLTDMVVGHHWHKRVACNWKVYWENFSECLHCPNLHPELSKLVPLYRRRIFDIKDMPNWQAGLKSDDAKYKGGLNKNAQTWSCDGSAQGHVINNITEQADFMGQCYLSTWPTMFLGAYADHIRTVTIVPIDSQNCQLNVEWLFEKKTLQDKNYKIANVVSFAKLVMKQDAQASELNQQGFYNHTFDKGVLMPEEYMIDNFHRWLKKQLKTNHPAKKS